MVCDAGTYSSLSGATSCKCFYDTFLSFLFHAFLIMGLYKTCIVLLMKPVNYSAHISFFSIKSYNIMKAPLATLEHIPWLLLHSASSVRLGSTPITLAALHALNIPTQPPIRDNPAVRHLLRHLRVRPVAYRRKPNLSNQTAHPQPHM